MGADGERRGRVGSGRDGGEGKEGTKVSSGSSKERDEKLRRTEED